MNWKQMNLDTFFSIASPTTLASLIADVQNAGTGAESYHLDLERKAYAELKANVGKEEADELIAEMMEPAPK